MNMKPMNLNELDYSNLTVSELKTLDNGGKICFVNYGEDSSSVQTQTGLQELPWDMNVYEDDGNKSYSLSLSFRSRDTNPTTKCFYEGLEKLDSAMLDLGVQNQLEWLKKKGKDRDAMEEDYYTPNIKWAKDQVTGERNTQYPPTFKVKLAQKNGKWAFDAFDQNREKIDFEKESLESLLVRGAKVKALLKLTTVWATAKGYGCKWAVMQLKIHRSQQLTGYAFADDDEEDDDELSRTNTEQKPSLTIDDDEDDEDEGEYLEEEVVVEEPEPDPPATKKKKVVRKKKKDA